MKFSKKIFCLTICLVTSLTINSTVFAKTDIYLKKNEIPNQYYFNVINLKKAWDLLTEKGYTKTKVGVIDTGVDPYHEDLKENLKEYVTVDKSEIKKGREDSGEHGSHVSGIIAATYGNGKGGSGVAVGYKNDMAELYVVGTINKNDPFSDEDVKTALDYLYKKGVRVVNMSFGGYEYSPDTKKMMREAYERGMVLVAASGNEDTNKEVQPGSLNEVIAVNASDEMGNNTYFSNYGIYTDISAPGSSIISTIPGDRYQEMSGTSMASPVVTGVISLMLSANKDLTNRQIYDIICNTANKKELKNKKFDKEQYAYGIIDAYEAVKAAYNAKNTNSSEVESIFAKEDVVIVHKGYEKPLEVLVSKGITDSKIEWKSSDENIATVDNYGYVKGVNLGEVSILVSSGDKTTSIKVNVIESSVPKSIKVNKSKKVVSVGEVGTINAKVLPEDSISKNLFTYSSDKSVLFPYSGGMYEAVGVGKAVITIKTINGLEKNFNIEVKPAVAKIRFKNKISKIEIGKTFKFEAEALNEDGGRKLAKSGVIWKVSNSDIATIDKKTGLFIANKEGKTYVIAKSKGLFKDGKNKVVGIVPVVIEKNKTKVSSMHILDEDRLYKSKAIETLSNYYSVFEMNRTQYLDEVIEVAKKIRKEATKIIYDAKSGYDLFDVEYNDDGTITETAKGRYGRNLSYLETLSKYDLINTGGNINLKELVGPEKSYINEKFKELGKENFNDYYWQLIESFKKEGIKKLKNVKNFESFIKLVSKYVNGFVVDSDFEFNKLDEITDYDKIYTKNDIEKVKEIVNSQLDSYIKELKLKSYKDIGTVKKIVDGYIRNINKSVNMAEIIFKKDEYINKLVKKTNIKYNVLFESKRIKVKAELNEILKKFKKEDYKDKEWDELIDLVNYSYDIINSAEYNVELSDFIKNTEKELSKIKKK